MSSGKPLGLGWSTVATIIIVVSLLGVLAFYLVLRQRRPPIPAVATHTDCYKGITSQSPVGVDYRGISPKRTTAEDAESRKVAFRTELEVVDGKLVIPRDDKSIDVALVNLTSSRILVVVEYDPESIPQGRAKIVVLGQHQNVKNHEGVAK